MLRDRALEVEEMDLGWDWDCVGFRVECPFDWSSGWITD